MKKLINVVCIGVIAFCLVYPYFDKPTIPTNPDKAVVVGIFDGLSDQLDENPKAFNSLIDVYNTIIEASHNTLGHPIHEIDGMNEFGTNLGVKIEQIVPDASVPLTHNQKKELSDLFEEVSRNIE